jgi:hypothetical protein
MSVSLTDDLRHRWIEGGRDRDPVSDGSHAVGGKVAELDLDGVSEGAFAVSTEPIEVTAEPATRAVESGALIVKTTAPTS